MTGLEIRTFDDYDAFAGYWHSEVLFRHDVTLAAARRRGFLDEAATRALWRLLDRLSDLELLFQVPEWFAEEQVAGAEGGPPTAFVGTIAFEVEESVRVDDAVAARALLDIADRIDALEAGLGEPDVAEDNREWLEQRVRDLRSAFRDRDGLAGLRDEWLSKDLLLRTARRA